MEKTGKPKSQTEKEKKHGKAVKKGNWAHSGITAHKQFCDAPIDWENATVLTTMHHKIKKYSTSICKYEKLSNSCAMTAAQAKA